MCGADSAVTAPLAMRRHSDVAAGVAARPGAHLRGAGPRGAAAARPGAAAPAPRHARARHLAHRRVRRHARPQVDGLFSALLPFLMSAPRLLCTPARSEAEHINACALWTGGPRASHASAALIGALMHVHASWSRQGCCCISFSGALALVANLETLATMVSVGALFVFLCVSAGVLWRRYRAPVPAPAACLAAHLAALCALSLGAPANLIQGSGCRVYLRIK